MNIDELKEYYLKRVNALSLINANDLPKDRAVSLMKDGKAYMDTLKVLSKIDEGKMVKKVFIRFGEIPENEKSLNHLTEKRETGISVYEGIEDDGKYSVIMPPLTYSCCVSLSGVLDRQAYLVDGVVIGSGSDGECLLKDCKIIKAINVSTNYLGGGE